MRWFKIMSSLSQVVLVGGFVFLLMAGGGCKETSHDLVTPSVDTGNLASDQNVSVFDEESNRDNMNINAKIGCSGFGCDGKDPKQMGCAADVRRVALSYIYDRDFGYKIGIVELQWSPTCGTNWAKITRYDGKKDGIAWEVIRKNPYKKIENTITGYTQIYSNMLYARGIPARACGDIQIQKSTGRPGYYLSESVGYGCASQF